MAARLCYEAGKSCYESRALLSASDSNPPAPTRSCTLGPRPLRTPTRDSTRCSARKDGTARDPDRHGSVQRTLFQIARSVVNARASAAGQNYVCIWLVIFDPFR
jgi:hypothetical protein